MATSILQEWCADSWQRHLKSSKYSYACFWSSLRCILFLSSHDVPMYSSTVSRNAHRTPHAADPVLLYPSMLLLPSGANKQQVGCFRSQGWGNPTYARVTAWSLISIGATLKSCSCFAYNTHWYFGTRVSATKGVSNHIRPHHFRLNLILSTHYALCGIWNWPEVRNLFNIVRLHIDGGRQSFLM